MRNKEMPLRGFLYPQKSSQLAKSCTGQIKVEQNAFTTEALGHGVSLLFFLVVSWFKKCTTTLTSTQLAKFTAKILLQAISKLMDSRIVNY
jgi:hypothetical protein